MRVGPLTLVALDLRLDHFRSGLGSGTRERVPAFIDTGPV